MANTVSAIISDETLSRIIQIESGGNPKAKAPTSSAGGLGQFVDMTWLGVVHKHATRVSDTKTPSQILALKYDPAFAIEMLARFTEDNAKALGSGWTEGDLYLAHFAGVGTALKLLSARPSTAVSSIMSQAAIAANRSILAGKTCGEVRNWAMGKMARAGGRDWVGKYYRKSPASVPPPVSPAAPSKTPATFWQRLLAALQRKG